MKRKPHWYFITFGCCPACGKSKEYREIRYTPRPDKWEDRHDEMNDARAYDHCL